MPTTRLPASAAKRAMKWATSGAMSSGRSRSGGHVDREDVEPVVEVFAELAGLGEVEQPPVGGRDDADIDALGAGRADRLDLALLDGAQQLDLRVERQFADLVEEERAAMGFGELAALVGDGAGEGALLVPEEGGFDQVGGDRAAVDGDERLAGAVAHALDDAGDQFLADAGFAFDQHRDRAFGRLGAERMTRSMAGERVTMSARRERAGAAVLRSVRTIGFELRRA